MKYRNFAEWMGRVDATLEHICGLSADDLADACYTDMYEDGMSPGQAAAEVMAENGWSE